jgi:hypothetical protein
VDVKVALSVGTGFTTPAYWGEISRAVDIDFADVNGDGSDDFVVTLLSSPRDDVVVQYASASGFGGAGVLGENVCPHQATCRMDDMNGDGKLDLVAFEKDGLLDNGLLPSAFRPHRLARVQVHLSLGTQLAAGVANYHELDCRGDRCLLVDVDGDDLPDVVEPFGSTIAGLGGDDLWVSLNNGITTNTLPGDIGSVGSGLCVPEPDEPSPLWKPISTFPVEEVAATSADLYALSSGGETVMRHTGGATWALSFASGLFAPVTGIGATEANVYMSRWGGILEQVSDGVWSAIGSMVSGSAWSKVVPGSSLLFATGGGYGFGAIYAYDCPCGSWNGLDVIPGWTVVDGLSTLDGSSADWAAGGVYVGGDPFHVTQQLLYRRDSAGVWAFDVPSETWTQVGGPAGEIWAGGTWVFATSPSNGDLYAREWQDPDWVWSRISGPASQFAADADSGALYRLGGNGVEKWGGGTSWVALGADAEQIFASRGRVFRTEVGTGLLYEFDPD